MKLRNFLRVLIIRIMPSVVASTLLAGCLPENAFAPPPDDYETWHKEGVGRTELWKTMLECGYASPFRPVESFPEGNRTANQIAVSSRCIENQGYVHKSNGRVTPVCSRFWKELPACQSAAKIPGPSKSVRLSSGYCKKYPKSEACVP